MLVHEKMKVNISYRNVTHYLKLGYNAIINQELEIKTIDLPSVSHVSVESICELCKSLNIVKYHKYVVNVKKAWILWVQEMLKGKIQINILK